MTDQAILGRISSNREIFGGKPIIRGMRISVEMVVNLLAEGETADGILADYPGLESDDIRACLAYAHRACSGFTRRGSALAHYQNLPRQATPASAGTQANPSPACCPGWVASIPSEGTCSRNFLLPFPRTHA